MAEVRSTCEVTSGAGESIIGVKDALPGKALGGDGSATCVDEPPTYETQRLEGTSTEVVSGCTSSGFTTQTDASELPSEGRRGSGVPKSSSRSVPKKSCRSGMFFVGGDAGMPSASPTKSLERRPAVFRSRAAESLGDSSERLRGGRDGPVAHDARTGCATNLKLLAENLVNETAQHGGASPRSCSIAASEGPSREDLEMQSPPPEEPVDAASVTRVASQVSEEAPAYFTEAPSTGAFAPCPTDSASAYEIDAAANEPALETVVVQSAPRAPSKSTVQVLRVEVPEAPVRPEHFSGSEAPLAASTLPLNSEVPRNNRPTQVLRHPRPHAMPAIATPLCTRWCCAKISMISMAIMSLFAAFMIYAFREDTFVDLVNWAATWNTSSIRARFVVTQALLPEAENITESGIFKRNVP
ncbi:uncharacterized protein [Dermacentor albipictus]|uniref:uncharacterized protein n=1 Tax=Dermacentor albipictus TaxID=60249 RepID=UPI0038FC6B99